MWSQCGWVDQATAGRRPRSASSPASAARSATVTAGSTSRQPPDAPTTTVLVVTAKSLVATSTPGAISVRRPIGPVYHQLALPSRQGPAAPGLAAPGPAARGETPGRG